MKKESEEKNKRVKRPPKPKFKPNRHTWKLNVKEREPDFDKLRSSINKHWGDVASTHDDKERQYLAHRTMRLLSPYFNGMKILAQSHKDPKGLFAWQEEAILRLRNNQQRKHFRSLFKLEAYARANHQIMPIGTKHHDPITFEPNYGTINKAISLEKRIAQAYLKELVDLGIFTVYQRKAHGQIIYQIGEWWFWKAKSGEAGVRRHFYLTEVAWRKAMKI